MDFQQAQQQFMQFEQQLQSGRIDLVQYRAVLESLRVVDGRGVSWQMQERTGVWHYYWQGQWMAGTPPVEPPATAPGIPPAPVQPGRATLSSDARTVYAPRTAAPVQTAGYPQGIPQSRPAVYPQNIPQGVGSAPLPKRRSRLPLALGLVALLVVLAAGVYLLVTQVLNKPTTGTTSPTGGTVQPTPPAEILTLQKLSDASVTANGSPVTDSNGVSIQIPAAALQTDTGKAIVTTAKMQGKLEQALSKTYTINSPVYTVEAEGKMDSNGRASLSFPAPSPDSRVAQIIDDRYVVMADKPPVNGKLTFGVRMGPSDTKDFIPAGSIHANGSARYMVITPKKAAVPNNALISARFDTVPGVNCSVGGETGITYCRANEDQTIKVMYDNGPNITAQELYNVAKEAEKWMNIYYKDKGFTNANLASYWFAMNIIILDDASTKDPYYSSKSGNIYMPLAYAKNINNGDNKYSLGHELGHWIEDEAYKMAWAGLKSYVSSGNYWWLEMAADNMVMLVEPGYISKIMQDYGKILNDNKGLVFQMAINQWPLESFYAQAQLVKLFMCNNDACVLSEKAFKEAINNGTYPFADAENKIGVNLEDYARYLIGAKPQKTNTTISLAAVADTTFGEIIKVGPKGTLSYENALGDRDPQIVTKTKDGFDSLDFNVPLEKNGVYPLTIYSLKSASVGLPVMLVIEAGMPLVYRLDGGDVKTHSGDKQLIIGPISSKLGYSEVRLAPYSSATGMTFKAHLQIVDLKGAWALQAAADATKSSVKCDNPPKSGVDNMYKILPLYGNISMAFGDFAPSGNAANKLGWTLKPGRIPADGEGGWTANYEVEITPDAVILKGGLDVPKTQAALPGPGDATAGLAGLTIGAVGLVGGAQLLRRRRRTLAIALLLALITVLLAGCIGFYGSSQVEIKITKFEATNGDTDATWNITTMGLPDTKAIWTITEATGTYLVISTTETDTGTKLLEAPVWSYNNCTGSLTYDLKGGIYPDITIISEK